ncbi:MAG: carbamoyltransferase HypF, partial [Magnetococcales bacterium]|nr:carbamoyltransferase HypF [Magnetococcales bacterium]
MTSCSPPPMQTWQITLGGLVQGVGFRPFVYALAKKWGLCGWVRNRAGVVEIVWQGEEEYLQQGLTAVFASPPVGATPRLLKQHIFFTQPVDGFQIIHGDEGEAGEITLPPDASLCPACRQDLDSPHNRRASWPFTACCHCGPRYTIIERFPYERENTTLHSFHLCDACLEEYQNPANRRFHAQATGCPRCGPHLYWHQQGHPPSTGEQALLDCLAALRRGEVVAVKGVGGYHLMADASQEQAVAHLRQNKPRPHKPLALLMDGLERVRKWCSLTPSHEQALQHPGFPIVLCPSDAFLPTIAPGLSEVGIMLPYAPLHHVLCREMASPLIATSANPTGEPVIWQPEEAEKRLGHVVHGFLHHNRTILRPADDGVVRIIANAPRPLRLGRGTSPLEISLPCPLSQPTLAVGGEQKITLALGIGQRAIVSPHIGEIHSPRGLALFEQLVEDFQKLLGVKATRIIHDRHPHLATSRWAKKQGVPCQAVLHHHAHASALSGEAGGDHPWLIFTWDGVGLGEDGTLWGGEALLGTPGRWQRVATWRPFSLPGGDLVARQPWRSAASLCWECDHLWPQLPPQGELLYNAWHKEINAPRTSAVG